MKALTPKAAPEFLGALHYSVRPERNGENSSSNRACCVETENIHTVQNFAVEVETMAEGLSPPRPKCRLSQ